ncbi:hypothetical protein [Vibrio vulnificus]|uniref:hypothetical protein n=1 Tax=Vibrio vulnificus TaxID=672 RepID=UPI001A21A4E4|nr:hypothetical protein [Vibrio vulnificus]
MADNVIYESDHNDHGIKVVSKIGRDNLIISANDDWKGGIVSGFGEFVDVELCRDEVKRLNAALGEWLKVTTVENEGVD